MTLAFDPIALGVGDYAVRWYALVALGALALGVWIVAREGAARGVPTATVLGAAALAIPAGILAGRLAHVVGAWELYLQRPEAIWGVPLHGLSLWGALVGGGLASAFALRADSRLRARVADSAVAGLAVGILFGRLGQLWDGVGQGLPSDLPWATRYTHPLSSVPDFGVPRHPAQLYDALAVATIYTGVRFLVGKRLRPGGLFWTSATIYAVTRLGLGGVRLDPTFILGLQMEQLIALGVLLAAALRAGRFVSRECRVVQVRGSLDV